MGDIMDKSRSTELVHAFFQAITNSDSAALDSLVTDTVRFWVPRSASDTGLIERPIEGREKVVPIVSQHEAFPEIVWVVMHIVVDGDLIAAHASTRGRTQTDKEYENEYHFLFRLQGEKIDEVWECLDTAYAFGQMS